jgi:glycosyltransferase involved in cell wall biosynthesis
MALRYLLHGQLHFMKQMGYDVLMVSAEGKEWPEVLAREQCRHVIIPMTRKITPWQDLVCLWKLIRLFRKEKPDIVHTHTPKAGLLGMLAARLSGVKIRIHTVAGMPLMVEKGIKYQILQFTEKLTYRAASQVWPNSFSLHQYITAHRMTSPQKLRVISKGSSNGIDTTRFSRERLDPAILEQCKTTLQYDTSLTYLLCVGRLVKDKGIAELVRVFIVLHKKYPQLRLVLVGQYEPDLDPLPAETLAAIQSHPGIQHIGWSNQVEYYMALAQLFVFPSHREGFPNVLLQAGAMHTPIVCSIIPGNSDIVEDRFTGLLFPVGDEAIMQQQITFAIEKPAAMNDMAEQLYRHIQQYYRQEMVWTALDEAYMQLLQLQQ